jgi:hypothetical protein
MNAQHFSDLFAATQYSNLPMFIVTEDCEFVNTQKHELRKSIYLTRNILSQYFPVRYNRSGSSATDIPFKTSAP